MPTNNNHIVNKLTIDVQVANEDHSFELRHQLSSYWHEWVVAGMEKVLNQADSREIVKIDKLEIKLDGKFDKLDERTKLSFWGFILRGLVLTALIGVGTYLLPVVAQYVDKLPSL